MSLDNSNVITRKSDKTPALKVETKKSTSWIPSMLNPFSPSSDDKNDEKSLVKLDTLPVSKNTMKNTIQNSEPSTPSDSDSENEESSFFSLSNFSPFNWSYKFIFFVIIVFALLGLNILRMAGTTLNVAGSLIDVAAIFFDKKVGFIFNMIGMGASNTVKKTSKMSAEGTKTLATAADNLVQNTVDEIDDLAGMAKNKRTKKESKEDTKKEKSKKQKDLEDAFERAKNNNNSQKKDSVKSDDSGSVMQRSNGSSKSGWCFIGEDNGFRSCIKVNESDKCMSGDIFPSKDICVNPSLRN